MKTYSPKLEFRIDIPNRFLIVQVVVIVAIAVLFFL